MEFSHYINKPVFVQCNPDCLLDHYDSNNSSCNYSDVRFGCDICGNGVISSFKLNITPLAGLSKTFTRSDFPTKIFNLQDLKIVPKTFYNDLPFYHVTRIPEVIAVLQKYYIQFEDANESHYDSGALSKLIYDSGSYTSSRSGLSSNFGLSFELENLENVHEVKLCPTCYHWIIKIPTDPKITEDHFIRVNPLQMFWSDFFNDEFEKTLFLYENPDDYQWILSQLRYRNLDLINQEISTAIDDFAILQTIFEDNGSFIDLRDQCGCTPLHRATSVECIQFLLKLGANINIYDNKGYLPIHTTIEKNNLECFQELLSHIETRTKSGMTLLHIATRHDNIPILQELIKLGARVDAKDDQESTPLHMAVYRGNLESLRELINAKASINSIDYFGKTPLFEASNNLSCVIELLKFGADPNIPNKYGCTPLHRAIERGQLECVQKLVEAGADTLIMNNEKETPYDIALKHHHDTITNYLKEYEDTIPLIKSAIN